VAVVRRHEDVSRLAGEAAFSLCYSLARAERAVENLLPFWSSA
jgi:hypothetical protein